MRDYAPGEYIGEIEAIGGVVYSKRSVPRYRIGNPDAKTTMLKDLSGYTPLPDDYRQVMRLVSVPVPCVPLDREGRVFSELDHVSKYVKMLMMAHPSLREMMDCGEVSDEMAEHLARFAQMLPMSDGYFVSDEACRKILDDPQLNRACGYMYNGAIELEQIKSGVPWGIAFFSPSVRASIGPDPETALYNTYGVVHVEAEGDDPDALVYRRFVLTLYAANDRGLAANEPLRIGIVNAGNARMHISMLARYTSRKILRNRLRTWEDSVKLVDMHFAYLSGAIETLKDDLEKRVGENPIFKEDLTQARNQVGVIRESLTKRYGQERTRVLRERVSPVHLVTALEYCVTVIFMLPWEFPEMASKIRNYLNGFHYILKVLGWMFPDAVCARFMNLPIHIERVRVILDRATSLEGERAKDPEALREAITQPIDEDTAIPIVAREKIPPNIRALVVAYMTYGATPTET